MILDESEREEFDWMDETLDDSVPSGHAWIIKFKRIYYPVFQKFGFSLAEAAILYKLNTLVNVVSDSSNPNEDWEEKENA